MFSSCLPFVKRPQAAAFRRFFARRHQNMAEEEVQALYEKAIAHLNALQSNALTLAQCRGEKRRQRVQSNVQETRDFLQMLDISLDDIDRLNVVHITGTKGKGSTAAFLESILRSLGYKTGFYSSPHLVHARERIRLNGRPISKHCFVQQFFPVYEAIVKRKREDQPMPAYFKFFTLLAMRIFYAESVDVAIVEVGIGGEYDCTNFIRRPVVCAMSTLDYDHTKLLGDTLREIAWNKAGIAKPDAVLLSVPQPPEAMAVIEARCAERKCPLLLVPPSLTAYRWPGPIQLGIAGTQQHINASLALQLARQWLLRCQPIKRHFDSHVAELLELDVVGDNTQPEQNGTSSSSSSGPHVLSGFAIPERVAGALAKCHWPGRSQVFQHRASIRYHLDGAHTPQSTQFCAEWFNATSSTSSGHRINRILIFHCTGDRNSAQLLANFKNCNFGTALFCPALTNPPDEPRPMGSDVTNLNIDPGADCRRCERDRNIWEEIAPHSVAEVYPCIADTLARVDALSANNPDTELHILVTGSLHLVGGVLALLDPTKADE